MAFIHTSKPKHQFLYCASTTFLEHSGLRDRLISVGTISYLSNDRSVHTQPLKICLDRCKMSIGAEVITLSYHIRILLTGITGG